MCGESEGAAEEGSIIMNVNWDWMFGVAVGIVIGRLYPKKPAWATCIFVAAATLADLMLRRR